jgi:hypothetical protein
MRLPIFCLLVISRLVWADPSLDAALDAVAPNLGKWGTVCQVKEEVGKTVFEWHDYRDTGRKTDFWPASTIKLPAAIAAIELLNKQRIDLDAELTFQHQDKDGRWITDVGRTPREMISEVFRRSSNEDYTLLLRLTGIDWLHEHFFTAERGFPKAALMRGYTAARPWAYLREEPQRVVHPSVTLTHQWKGRFYAAERGCTIIDSKTGNMTTTRELCDTLRRVMFHDQIEPAERFRLTSEQVRFLREGGDGLTGLETSGADSGPSAWKGAAETMFPNARYFHKSGLISNYALDLACIDARAQNGPCYLIALAVNAGHASPVHGDELIRQMSLAVARWVEGRR